MQRKYLILNWRSWQMKDILKLYWKTKEMLFYIPSYNSKITTKRNKRKKWTQNKKRSNLRNKPSCVENNRKKRLWKVKIIRINRKKKKLQVKLNRRYRKKKNTQPIKNGRRRCIIRNSMKKMSWGIRKNRKKKKKIKF